MTYATILVQSEPGEVAVARLKCAADLADRFQASLIGLAAECVNPAMAAEPYNAYSAEWVVAMHDEAEAHLRSAAEAFRMHCGIRRESWITRRVMPAQALAEASRAADLIVAGGAAKPSRNAYVSADIADLLMISGRPVLVAPPTGDFCSAKSVVVAWKDSREARRAVTDALPFLKAADEVLVLEACSTADLTGAREHTAEVAAALGRHGVNARSDGLVIDDEPDLTVISRARHLGADLIVAGAYGHSRLGEWVFGGMTRQLLAQTERFVLFSH